MKYRLKVKMGRKQVIGVKVYDTLEEATAKMENIIALGKAAGKKTIITIVDSLGAPIE